jgi:diguanylate cyclase (GGDEF)-like protein/PAS domain S-box-containing protein
VAGGYAFVAALWILLSDTAFAVLGAPAESTLANIAKGLLFVAVTALVLYRLVRAMYRRQHDLNAELARHVEVQATLFNHSPEAMWVYDPDSLAILEVNDTMLRRSGRSREELIGLPTTDLGPSAGGDHMVQRAASGPYEAEPTLWLHFGPQGEHRWVEVVTHTVEWNGSFAMLALSRDITAQKRAEDALRSSERRLAGVLGSMQEMAFSIDLSSGHIDYLNDAVAKVLGRDMSDLVHTLDAFEAIVHPDDLETYRNAMRETVTAGWADVEFRIVDLDDGERTLHVRVRGMVGPSGRVEHVDGVAVDMTHRHALVEMVEHQRSFDLLTGLPNRLSLVAAMDAALAGGAAESASGGFVALFDLDRFATINQSAGHHVGDAVLVAVAERVTATLRPGMVAARVGGDEFAVFCPMGVATSEELVDALRDAVDDVFTVGDYEFFLTTSIGVAEATVGLDAEGMLRDAHVAMTQAKDHIEGVEYFHPAYRSLVTDQVRIERELRDALAGDQLVVVFQPQVSLQTDRIVGVEALVRWAHPVRGLVAAAEFIEAAERSHVIHDIGRRVLDLSCMQAVEWSDRYGSAAPRIWVNLSRRELDAPGLVSRFLATVSAHRLDRSAIGVEVTETAFVADSGRVAATLRELSDAGIGLALDDFGTGWSSLQSLKAFPLEMVKIDRSFTRHVGESVDDTQICKAVIGMAKGMSMLSLAEGVESSSQLAELRRMGCDQAQGHLLGRPSSAEQIEELLDTGGKPTVFLR